MTAPLKTYTVTPEVIHHTPTYVAETDFTDYYPLNPRWPVDPDVAKGGTATITQEGK